MKRQSISYISFFLIYIYAKCQNDCETNLADVDSIVSGLHQFRSIRREMVSVHELLSAGLVLFLDNHNEEMDLSPFCKRNSLTQMLLFVFVFLLRTIFMILALVLASSMLMESVELVNLRVSGCCLYFFSSRAAAAALALSTSMEPIGTQPIPLTEPS